jgi:hypothetical protein
MMRFLLLTFVLTMLMAACAPAPLEQPQTPDDGSYPNPSYPSPSYPNDGPSADLTPAQTAALTHLSETLNLPADQITLISTESVTWPDGCLGIERPDVMCTQALVEGYRIIFEAGGREYEVRTNESGSAVVIAGGLDISSMIETVLIRQLAENLGLDESDISVVTNEPVEFPDACLGVVMQEVMCAEVLTPGRVVILEVDDVQYEYHVSEDGMRIQPATIALTWARDGGIAGFCDRLTVFLSGEVYGSRCAGQPDGTMGIFSNLLTDEQREQFGDWVRQYGEVSIDASDPKNVSDRMTVTLEFFGIGQRTSATTSDSQELLEFAQTIYQKLYE